MLRGPRRKDRGCDPLAGTGEDQASELLSLLVEQRHYRPRLTIDAGHSEADHLGHTQCLGAVGRQQFDQFFGGDRGGVQALDPGAGPVLSIEGDAVQAPGSGFIRRLWIKALEHQAQAMLRPSDGISAIMSGAQQRCIVQARVAQNLEKIALAAVAAQGAQQGFGDGGE